MEGEMSEITLSGYQVFWIIIVGQSSLAVAWCATFYFLRDKEDPLKSLLAGGNVIKIMTVMFVVFATGILAILERFDQSVGTIFSGIAGYVLGSMRRSEAETQADIGRTDSSAQRPQV
jgi:hypothetical protein